MMDYDTFSAVLLGSFSFLILTCHFNAHQMLLAAGLSYKMRMALAYVLLAGSVLLWQEVSCCHVPIAVIVMCMFIQGSLIRNKTEKTGWYRRLSPTALAAMMFPAIIY